MEVAVCSHRSLVEDEVGVDDGEGDDGAGSLATHIPTWE